MQSGKKGATRTIGGRPHEIARSLLGIRQVVAVAVVGILVPRMRRIVLLEVVLQVEYLIEAAQMIAMESVLVMMLDIRHIRQIMMKSAHETTTMGRQEVPVVDHPWMRGVRFLPWTRDLVPSTIFEDRNQTADLWNREETLMDVRGAMTL